MKLRRTSGNSSFIGKVNSGIVFATQHSAECAERLNDECLVSGSQKLFTQAVSKKAEQ
jgi:hypothetical protein